MQIPLLLASNSPRRLEILTRLGFTCTVKVSGVDEAAIRHPDAAEQTIRIAQAKTHAVAQKDFLTVAADTVVVLDGSVLEKPQDKDEARTMLQSLSHRSHEVFTAVSLIFPFGEKRHFLEKTKVFFRKLTDATIEEYITTPAPYDKAGGYGVQDTFGMANICRIEGCYFNVMGFPTSRFMATLVENQKFLL